MRKILIFGNYGAKNFGDELVLKGILNMVEGDITVLSSDPKETSKLHHVKSAWVFPTGLRSLLRGTIFKTLNYYRNADMILFGGGTLFTDEEPRTIWVSGMQILPAILMQKRIICFRQGIGPIKHRKIVKWIFNRFETIEVRDKESARELEKIGIKHLIEVKPDPAFSLPMKKSNGDELLVSLRDWPTLDPKFAEKLTKFIKWTEMPTRFLSFDPDDEKLAKKLDIESTQITLENYEQIFSRGKFVIAMRFHACILSFMHEIPCIGFAYESKITNLFREHSKDEYVININDINLDQLKQKFLKLKSDAQRSS